VHGTIGPVATVCDRCDWENQTVGAKAKHPLPFANGRPFANGQFTSKSKRFGAIQTRPNKGRAVKAGKIRDCISTGTVQPQKQTNNLKRKELTPDQSSSFSPSTPLAIAGGLHADMRNNSRNNNSNDNHLSAPQYSRSYCKSS
jgi:hypothetical protein